MLVNVADRRWRGGKTRPAAARCTRARVRACLCKQHSSARCRVIVGQWPILMPQGICAHSHGTCTRLAPMTCRVMLWVQGVHTDTMHSQTCLLAFMFTRNNRVLEGTNPAVHVRAYGDQLFASLLSRSRGGILREGKHVFDVCVSMCGLARGRAREMGLGL